MTFNDKLGSGLRWKENRLCSVNVSVWDRWQSWLDPLGPFAQTAWACYKCPLLRMQFGLFSVFIHNGCFSQVSQWMSVITLGGSWSQILLGFDSLTENGEPYLLEVSKMSQNILRGCYGSFLVCVSPRLVAWILSIFRKISRQILWAS